MKPGIVHAQPILFDMRDAAAFIGVSLRIMEKYVAAGTFELTQLPHPDDKDAVIKKNLIARDDLERFVREKGKRA